MPDYEMEISRTIWDNKHGTTIVIKPDGDGLGLIEVSQSETKNTITVTTEQARILATALLDTATEMEAA